MTDIHSILKKYWGYSTFRPLQQDIIYSVLDGKDTLALLPTGGGKSICFQVPALSKDGLCLVISPLIALMKDQVENLRKKKIEAIAIYSGMTKKEIDIALDNCAYGNIKFLYVSPERLVTDIFRERIHKFKLNLIAVDEAHCISQWGYDFRPPYLQIAELRKYVPEITVLALTATATPKVCDDICDKLEFKQKNIYRKSFERKNISFIVREQEDKNRKLIEILNKVKGSGIIYVRNRKKTKDLAEFLKRNKISADYYHAGLTNDERAIKQDEWIKNKMRIIVCTNAFGMGIDKPDVRIVVHWDIPESLEAYYQEAGRAGRDNKIAYAGLIYNASDVAVFNEYNTYQYPELDFIKKIYHLLGNYCNIATGAGAGESFDFDVTEFCKKYQLQAVQTMSALRILQQHNLIYVGDAINRFSTLHITVDKETIYKFQVENKNYEQIIKLILRTCPGVFDEFVPVREKEFAFHLSLTPKKIADILIYLQKQNILQYNPVNKTPQITFIKERLPSDQIHLDISFITRLKKTAENRTGAMLQYIQNKTICRTRVILNYFGEQYKRCAKCDICIERDKLGLNDNDFNKIYAWMQNELKAKPKMPEEIYKLQLPLRKEKFMEALSFMTDSKIIIHTADNLLVWKG